MGRGKSTDGDIYALGVLITASYELSNEWRAQAACRDWQEVPTPWHFSPGQESLRHIRSDEAVAFALIVCQSCPVQYDCAAWATEGRMRAGTWAMPENDLDWLQRTVDWRDTLAAGRESGLPVQRVVAQVRRARENPDAPA